MDITQNSEEVAKYLADLFVRIYPSWNVGIENRSGWEIYHKPDRNHLVAAYSMISCSWFINDSNTSEIDVSDEEEIIKLITSESFISLNTGDRWLTKGSVGLINDID